MGSSLSCGFRRATVPHRIQNTNTPGWDAVLDFGCLPVDTPISIKVMDSDYFSDESCLGPITIRCVGRSILLVWGGA